MKKRNETKLVTEFFFYINFISFLILTFELRFKDIGILYFIVVVVVDVHTFNPTTTTRKKVLFSIGKKIPAYQNIPDGIPL